MIMKVKKVAGLTVAALAVFLAAAVPAAAGEGNRGTGKLTGTWKVTVTTYNCVSGAMNPSFVSILTYHDGGTMTEVTANPGFQPGQRSVGLGSWMRTGGNSYWSTTQAFIQFNSPAPPPINEFQRGEQRIDQGIRMTGRNSWSSEARISLTNADGIEYAKGCARAVATRLE